jgi:putative nucleotidyltransferase with HDIG domain
MAGTEAKRTPEVEKPVASGEPLSARWTSGLVHGSLLAVVSVAAAFIIAPSFHGQIPEIGREDLGKPFRTNSRSGFKASRDYEIVDRTLTERNRQEARAAVRPVYDFNRAVPGELRQSIREAFGSTQQVVARFERPAPELTPATEEANSAQGRKRKKPDPPAAAKDDSLSKRLWSERRSFEQRLSSVEDEDFQALVEALFSAQVEQAALSLIERAYHHSPLAISREELSQVGSQGITIRMLSGGGELASPVSSPSVNDLREAKSELDRFVAGPGFLPDAPPALRRAVLRLAKRQLRPNLTINIAETEARREKAGDAVKEAVVQVRKGERVIGNGEPITETHLAIVATMRARANELDILGVRVGGAGLVGMLIATGYAFHRAAFRRFRPSRKDALLLGALLLALLGLIRLSVTVAEAVHDKYGAIPLEALHYAIPVAAGAMLVRFLLNQEMAIFFSLVLSLLAGVMLGNSLPFGIYSLVGSLVAADRIAKAKDRVGIFGAGLAVGVVNVPTILLFTLAEGKGVSLDGLITAAVSLAGNALLLPMLVIALTPLIELTFGYASDLKLLELANLNHPALKELIVQAPGTYHHSIILGSLVESAAEAIGANALLARSCAYYHDIGKGRNPLYFGENQKGENRHDGLAPAMSAVIVKRHVTDGVEMARIHKLPKLVADVIPQHHGTRLVSYFHYRAIKEQEGKANPQPIDEAIYRYPGPKPQFREAALVMIADAVEAASRSIPEPSTENLQALVQRLINLIFSEGQLDECDLTLRDLNLIAQSFVHTFEGIYHTRPAYPAAAVGGGRPSSGEARPVSLVGSRQG